VRIDPAMTHPYTRRLVLGGLIAGPALYAHTAFAAAARLLFHVFRKGTKLGEHHMSFSVSGDATAVETDVSMTLMLGPVTVLKYTHHASEHWRAGRIESLETRTVANGNAQHLSAKRTGDAVTVDGSKIGHAVLSGAAAPMTHWNADAMHAPLFNPQDGKLVRESLAHSRGSFTPPNTSTLATSKIVMTGEAELTDWYDTSGAWLALRGKVKDGSFVDYVRV
jgi:hypothetical protein